LIYDINALYKDKNMKLIKAKLLKNYKNKKKIQKLKTNKKIKK